MHTTMLYFHVLLTYADITIILFYKWDHLYPGLTECKSVIRMTFFSNFIENGIIDITF